MRQEPSGCGDPRAAAADEPQGAAHHSGAHLGGDEVGTEESSTQMFSEVGSLSPDPILGPGAAFNVSLYACETCEKGGELL